MSQFTRTSTASFNRRWGMRWRVDGGGRVDGGRDRRGGGWREIIPRGRCGGDVGRIGNSMRRNRNGGTMSVGKGMMMNE